MSSTLYIYRDYGYHVWHEDWLWCFTILEIHPQNNKVVLVKMEQHDASPTMQMGCSAGTLHLRLNLAIPPTPPLFSVLAPSPTPPGTKEYLSTDSPGDSKALWPMGESGAERTHARTQVGRPYWWIQFSRVWLLSSIFTTLKNILCMYYDQETIKQSKYVYGVLKLNN